MATSNLKPGQWVTIKSWGRSHNGRPDAYINDIPTGTKLWYLRNVESLQKVSTEAYGHGRVFHLLDSTVLEPCYSTEPLSYKFT